MFFYINEKVNGKEKVIKMEKIKMTNKIEEERMS